MRAWFRGLMVVVLLAMLSGCGGGGSTQKPPNEIVLNDDVKPLTSDETSHIEIVEGQTGGAGSITFSDPNVVKNWKKGEVKIIPPGANMPEGLALKVVSVSTTGGKSKVTYQTPSIDELFKNATIDIDQGLSTNMILSAKMRNGVALNFGITKEQDGRLGRGVWFPDGKTTHHENATPIHDNAIDTINMSFESMVYEDKEENELLKISGKTTLKNMRVKYSFSQSITPPKLKSNFSLSYEASSELRADLVVHKKGNAANVAPKTFQCGGIDIDKEGLGYKVKISGADFDKKDICIGSLSVELSEVPIKASVGGGAITDAPIGLRLFFIMGADMEIKVSSTVILRKSDYREVGVKVDTTKSGKEQFDLWNHDYVSKTNHSKATWEKKIYGEISGRMTQYQGLAAAPFVLGIYPAVVRAYAGPELAGTAKAGYGTRTGLNACFDVALAAKYGMTASVYLGIDLDNQYWDKLDWHHVFEYYNDIKGSDQLYAYNSCQADGYTVSFGTPPQSAGDFSAANIKVKDSTGRLITPEKITYNLYSNGHIIRSGDSVDALVADLGPGNYAIEAIVLIDSDRTIKSSIRHAYTIGGNQPPTANAGADQQVESNATVTLDGSGSSDSDGQIVSYVWSEGGTQVGTGVSVALDNVPDGVHTYILTVTDDDNATASDGVVITIGSSDVNISRNGYFSYFNRLYITDGKSSTTNKIKSFHTLYNNDVMSGIDIDKYHYFVADDGNYGRELWKTDGTTLGTTMVKDINPGDGGAIKGRLAKLNNILYFSALNHNAGYENRSNLWRSDGTNDGTYRVKEFALGCPPEYLIAHNNILYFISRHAIWKSNGTAESTILMSHLQIQTPATSRSPHVVISEIKKICIGQQF